VHEQDQIKQICIFRISFKVTILIWFCALGCYEYWSKTQHDKIENATVSQKIYQVIHFNKYARVMVYTWNFILNYFAIIQIRTRSICICLILKKSIQMNQSI
jgi:hypothetical protein